QRQLAHVVTARLRLPAGSPAARPPGGAAPATGRRDPPVDHGGNQRGTAGDAAQQPVPDAQRLRAAQPVQPVPVRRGEGGHRRGEHGQAGAGAEGRLLPPAAERPGLLRLLQPRGVRLARVRQAGRRPLHHRRAALRHRAAEEGRGDFPRPSSASAAQNDSKQPAPSKPLSSPCKPLSVDTKKSRESASLVVPRAPCSFTCTGVVPACACKVRFSSATKDSLTLFTGTLMTNAGLTPGSCPAAEMAIVFASEANTMMVPSRSLLRPLTASAVSSTKHSEYIS